MNNEEFEEIFLKWVMLLLVKGIFKVNYVIGDGLNKIFMREIICYCDSCRVDVK